jgi:hypothetical protein
MERPSKSEAKNWQLNLETNKGGLGKEPLECWE